MRAECNARAEALNHKLPYEPSSIETRSATGTFVHKTAGIIVIVVTLSTDFYYFYANVSGFLLGFGDFRERGFRVQVPQAFFGALCF